MFGCCVCTSAPGGSGSRLVTTHLPFSGLIVGDGHVVLITCSIMANVNKGLHWRPVTLPVWAVWGRCAGMGGGGLTKVRKSLLLISLPLTWNSQTAAREVTEKRTGSGETQRHTLKEQFVPMHQFQIPLSDYCTQSGGREMRHGFSLQCRNQVLKALEEKLMNNQMWTEDFYYRSLMLVIL